MPDILKLVDITMRFGPLVANDGISLSLGEGEVLALMGENGAGKTTLMNILFGHYVADEGYAEAFGERLAPGQPDAALDAVEHERNAIAVDNAQQIGAARGEGAAAQAGSEVQQIGRAHV